LPALQELLLLPNQQSQPPQAEVIPARKKPRLEEPISGSTDEAATNTASPDISEMHSPSADDDDDDDDANTDAESVTDTQSKPRAKKRDWASEEDAKLTIAVANTSKKKWGKEYKTDWPAISSLVPGRTRRQCWFRWHDVLDPNIDRTPPGRTGKWKEDEDSKLNDAVQTHGAKNWAAIAALVPGRTRKQCGQRWKDVLDPSIDRTPLGRTCNWAEDEDSKLKNAVQKYDGKNWAAIAALVPGRTKVQCRNRLQSLRRSPEQE
jgi:hypothetical protein